MQWVTSTTLTYRKPSHVTVRLDDLSRSFGRHLRAEGASERTVTIYGQSVRFFSAWLAKQGRPATLDELTRAAVREWLAQQQATQRHSLATTCG